MRLQVPPVPAGIQKPHTAGPPAYPVMVTGPPAADHSEAPCILKVPPGLEQEPSPHAHHAILQVEGLLQSKGEVRRDLQRKLQQLERENKQLENKNYELKRELESLKQPTAVVRERTQLGSFDDGRRVNLHSNNVHSVAMVPTGATSLDQGPIFASASWDGTVRFYDVSRDIQVNTLGPDYGAGSAMQGLYSVAFAVVTPNVLGVTSCDKFAYLWNWRDNCMLQRLEGHTDEVNGCDFHPQQQVMCTASDDCSVIIWDYKEGQQLRRLDKHDKAVYGATFFGKRSCPSEYEYSCASCCFDRKARVWDIRTKTLSAVLDCGTDDLIGIDFSAQLHFLAVGGDDGTISLWDARKWKRSALIDTRSDSFASNEVKRVSFSPDGRKLAAACSSGHVLVYDVGISVEQPQLLADLDGHEDCVFDVAWGICPGSNRNIVVSASHDKSSMIWKEVR
jgi:WD40 repeat protein